MESQIQKRPRVLCFHGFRLSAAILQNLVQRWPEAVLRKIDFVFIDAPFAAQGDPFLQGVYDPPFFEWFQANKDCSEFYNFEECVRFVEHYMLENGPFDGLLGFSQGAILSAALAGLQMNGKALTEVPKIRFVVLISGGRFGCNRFPGVPEGAADAYSSVIDCPSLHVIGERDFMREDGIALLGAFEKPVVVRHLKGHIVPQLEGENLSILMEFFERMVHISSQ